MSPIVITSSPHVRTDVKLRTIMYDVVIALMPALIASIWLFGFRALIVNVVAIASVLVFEALYLRIAGKENIRDTVFDGSAIITGILLAMNIPASSPVWMIVLGGFVAIIIAKQVFGGLGYNIFNPALVARVFLLISFPVQMTAWTRPTYFKADAITAATPLGMLKTDGLQAVHEHFNYMDYFLGNLGGSLGEMSALAILLGGIYLMIRKVITWEIPATVLGSLFLFTGIFWAVNPAEYASPVFHILTGGAMLGAFFMATDMVTSPMTRKGKVIFGISIGLLTGIIRLFGGYPEGVSFAILIMNAFVPLIDKVTGARKFGAGEVAA